MRLDNITLALLQSTPSKKLHHKINVRDEMEIKDRHRQKYPRSVKRREQIDYSIVDV